VGTIKKRCRQIQETQNSGKKSRLYERKAWNKQKAKKVKRKGDRGKISIYTEGKNS
jgi:hypothetical protein